MISHKSSRRSLIHCWRLVATVVARILAAVYATLRSPRGTSRRSDIGRTSTAPAYLSPDGVLRHTRRSLGTEADVHSCDCSYDGCWIHDPTRRTPSGSRRGGFGPDHRAHQQRARWRLHDAGRKLPSSSPYRGV